jgi:hypothetical protein
MEDEQIDEVASVATSKPAIRGRVKTGHQIPDSGR